MSDPVISSLERSLLSLRRRQRRNAMAGHLPASHVHAVEVADAISSWGDEATVADVGTALGVDPSQASRRVAAAVTAGLVARGASQADGRRSALSLTPLGASALEEARARREALVVRATEGWSPADVVVLADLLQRLVVGIATPATDGATARRRST